MNTGCDADGCTWLCFIEDNIGRYRANCLGEGDWRGLERLTRDETALCIDVFAPSIEVNNINRLFNDTRTKKTNSLYIKRTRDLVTS